MKKGKAGIASLPARRWAEMDIAAIREADTADWIAILPLGATEQHGPHLPPETDTIIAQGVCERLAEALPARIKASFLPAEPVGYSPEHLDWPRTRSLAYDEAVNRWIGIGEFLFSLGIRKLVLLNAHGGNSPLMTIVATELRVRFGMFCLATSWTRFCLPEGLVAPEEAAIDIHGGFIETSVMLALKPDLVDMRKARKFPSEQSRFLKRNRFLSAYGKHAFGWKMQDLNPKGVAGDARSANAAAGEAILSHSVAGLVQLLQEADRFDLALFEREPDSR